MTLYAERDGKELSDPFSAVASSHDQAAIDSDRLARLEAVTHVQKSQIADLQHWVRTLALKLHTIEAVDLSGGVLGAGSAGNASKSEENKALEACEGVSGAGG